MALVGHPANFVRISETRVSPEFGLLCARKSHVSCFFDLAYSLQKASYHRLEANGIDNSSSFQAL
jgi:hypothetical protein